MLAVYMFSAEYSIWIILNHDHKMKEMISFPRSRPFLFLVIDMAK